MFKVITASLIFLTLQGGSAQAEKDYVPWYRGKYGKNRITHMAITSVAGLAWLADKTVLNSTFASRTCQWCDPPPFDRAIRNAVVWDNPDRASLYSSIDAYMIAPAVGLTLLVISDRDASASRLIDDILPVAETVAISQLFSQVFKWTIRRRRPYKEFDPSRPYTPEENVSMASGHASLGFAITASAGMICHWRHYWTEPYVWGTGIALSLSTEYLRMAADKHYLSDVVVGGLIGLGSGLVVPRLMRRDVRIVPVPGGAAVVGQF